MSGRVPMWLYVTAIVTMWFAGWFTGNWHGHRAADKWWQERQLPVHSFTPTATVTIRELKSEDDCQGIPCGVRALKYQAELKHLLWTVVAESGRVCAGAGKEPLTTDWWECDEDGIAVGKIAQRVADSLMRNEPPTGRSGNTLRTLYGY